ncbi:MAG: polysaccharide deacetylase family protein [Salinivirgaceae bacterium]|jgi:hypothetical protein
MFLIYTHKITNRLDFILDFVFAKNFGLDYRITTLREEFCSYDGPKLNYSLETFDDIINIQPKLLLSQEDITPQHIDVEEHNGIVILFPVERGALPFDIFAASFYLITRYEEYIKSKVDRFGRFDPRSSIAWQKGFLTEPVVNIWISWLKDIISKTYPELTLAEPKYKFVATIDIDNAYAYINKGFFRQTGGLVRSLFKADFKGFSNRLKVFFGSQKDPYDTYDILDKIHEKYELTPYYFFLLANYGGYDKSVPYNNKEFQELIQDRAQNHIVGIHPSFSSFVDFSVLQHEVSVLSEIIGKDVENSRFHFVKFSLPGSYENLLNLNIYNDFSMGYPSRIGFRTGYAGDVNFFNLKTNKVTPLVVHPFHVMDAALNLYMKLSPDEAVTQARNLINKVKEVNGTFTLLWHNESLCGCGQWQGWESVYEQIVRHAIE